MKKNLKIAIDIRNIGRNRTGSETVVLQLVKHLLRIDSKNQYKLLTDTDEQQVLDYVNEHLQLADKKNVEVISLPAKNKFVWVAWTVWRWVRKNPVDVYHTEYILPFFMPKSVKLITHIHDVSFKAYRDLISWKDIFFLDYLIPWSIKRADRIIAVSQFTKDEIEKYYPASHGKVELIYNAVPDDFASEIFKKTESRSNLGSTFGYAKDFLSELAKVRKKYNLPEKYILALGTMQPRKNIPFLIKAYSKIYKKLDGVKLVLVGKKAHNFDSEIENLIEKSGQDLKQSIFFTGYVDEKDKSLIFAGAEIFVYPSLYEGFGIPPLEAIYCGTPILVSNIPVHLEVFESVADFFSPFDIDQCAKLVYDKVNNKRDKQKLFEKVLQLKKKFNYEESAKKFLFICQKVV